MKSLLCCILCTAFLLGGCGPKDGSGSADAGKPEGTAQTGQSTSGQQMENSGLIGKGPAGAELEALEGTLSVYLDCTAEAAVDTVLDGLSLVQSQLFLADRCNTQKIAVLSGVQQEEERANLAQRLKEWDLATISAVRDRLYNLETLLKAFMDCSYVSVRGALSHDNGDVDDTFMENLVNREIAACYDENLALALHPGQSVQSPVGLARKDRVVLIAKERIMRELYNELQREREGDMQQDVPGKKGEVVAAL